MTADPNAAPRAKPNYVSVAQVNALEAELTDARAAIEKVQHRRRDRHVQVAIPRSLQFVTI